MMRDAAAGFSLVELLVALAVGSAIAVGLGGLLALAGELRSRTSDVAAVSSTLVDMETLALLLEHSRKGEITRFDDTHFEIVLPPAGPRDAGALSIVVADRHITVSAGVNKASTEAAPPTSSVDVSVFDMARFEYLLEDIGGARWAAAELTSDGAVLAVRAVLRRDHRTWPVVLWVQPVQ
jgi:prepilin-type N-terminal cleavage/methylation domain-containing protein